VHVDVPLDDDDVAADGTIEELGAGEHAPGMAGEVVKESELRRRAHDGLVAQPHLVARGKQLLITIKEYLNLKVKTETK
jgi:hypothetical protein